MSNFVMQRAGIAALVLPSLVAIAVFAQAPRTGSALVERVTALSASEGKLMLVRQGASVGAFKFVSRSTHPGIETGISRYEWWYQPDGSRNLTKEDVVHGFSDVFEDYERVQNSDGTRTSIDKGGSLNIEVGPIEVEWSFSEWVYPHSSRHENVNDEGAILELAGSEWRNLKDVDYTSNSLKWISDPSHANRRSDAEVEATVAEGQWRREAARAGRAARGK